MPSAQYELGVMALYDRRQRKTREGLCRKIPPFIGLA